MFIPAGKRYLFDIETTGLLPYLTEHLGNLVKSRVHILAIRDLDTRQTFVFRNNKRMNNIAKGIAMLNEAGLLVGHNIVGFDIPALELLYPEVCAIQATLRDTLVLSRVFFADEKERDFRRWKRGELDGKEIGRHGLEAWGQRMGLHKGDYSKAKAEEIKAKYPQLEKEEVTRLVWSEWNQEMEDYCVQDIEVNEALWMLMVANPRRHSDDSIILEHRIHYLMEQTTNNGFPFDIEGGHVLEAELRAVVEVKEALAIEHFGKWWVPSKWKTIGKEYTVEVIDAETGKPTLDDNGKISKTKKAFKPRTDFGEDHSRQNWGDIVNPKKTMKFKPESGKADKEAGCPYCPVEFKEFNPGSRHQIIDRLTKVYDWEPQEFTETGQPAVNDEVLRDLAHSIPICEELAELFYYNKRLGQLVDGKNGWIGKAMERHDGRIHSRFNVGGTVTNRASHSDPNIAQVPRVVFKKPLWKNADGTPCLGPDGKQIRGRPVYDDDGVTFKLDADGAVVTKKVLMKGREGDHGWDSRNLFYVPDGWLMMGADQKGIELRALGHFMAEFDQGEYARLVVESDPHDLHTAALELESRDTAKTFIYALIYGAQDFKLGTVIDPALAMKPQEAKRVGAEMRRRLMTRIPALGLVVKNVQKQAKSGMLDALDGRKLFVRAQHAALNTLLQGAGATIAKQWCVNFAEYCEEDGLKHGWDGDFAILAWIHDELQVAVRDDPRIIEICQRNIAAAAYDAGMQFGFRCPVDVDVKFGKRWSDTH